MDLAEKSHIMKKETAKINITLTKFGQQLEKHRLRPRKHRHIPHNIQQQKPPINYSCSTSKQRAPRAIPKRHHRTKEQNDPTSPFT